MTRRLAPVLASVTLAAGALSACGKEEKSSQLDLTAKTGEQVASGAKSGDFRLLPAAAKSFDGMKGSATLTRTKSGTTVRVEVSGLNPGTELESHVHEKPCAQDAGGDHYQFLKGGEDEPPNEIHAEPLVAGKDGAASATDTVPDIAGPLALSIVVHDAIRGGKVGCADLA